VALLIGALAVATFQDESWSIASVALWSGVGLLIFYVVLWFRLDSGWRKYIREKDRVDGVLTSLYEERDGRSRSG